MKELLEYLARSLVDHPDAVTVDEVDDDGGVIYELRVDPEDVGKVIGRQGRIAKSLRTLVKAAGTKEGGRVGVEIIG